MTTTTSDDFYVTLPSDASTDEFQANAPNHFTVRLPRPLHLLGEGWKVGLSSLSLPDTRADLYRLVPKQQYLFSLKWFVLRNGKRTRRRTTVQMDDIDHLDSVVDGEHFMRAIIQHLEGQRRRGRHGDLFINDRVLTLVREMGLGAARFRSGPEDQQHRHGAGRKAQDHQSGHRCGLGAQDGVVAPEREPGLYLGSQSALGIHRAGTQ